MAFVPAPGFLGSAQTELSRGSGTFGKLVRPAAASPLCDTGARPCYALKVSGHGPAGSWGRMLDACLSLWPLSSKASVATVFLRVAVQGQQPDDSAAVLRAGGVSHAVHRSHTSQPTCCHRSIHCPVQDTYTPRPPQGPRSLWEHGKCFLPSPCLPLPRAPNTQHWSFAVRL